MYGEAFDDDFALHAKENKSKVLLYGIAVSQLMVGYSFENWDLVQKLLPVMRKHEKEGKGYFSEGINQAWTGLAHYDLYHKTGEKQHRREGRRAHCKIKKWVANGTVMLLGSLQLLTAMESLCVTKAPLHEVDSLFEKAFLALSESKSIYFEAMGNERLAKLYLTERVDEAKGTRYLGNAIGLYQRWGALAKVTWLKNRYDLSQVADG